MKSKTVFCIAACVLVGCGAGVTFNLGYPKPLALSDVCGASSSCGMSGKIVWADGDVQVLTGDAKRSVGVVDTHKGRWLFNTPDLCGTAAVDPAKVSETAQSQSKITMSDTMVRNFIVDVKAKLSEELKEYATGTLAAGVDSAFDKQLKGTITVSPHLLDLDDDEYRKLKKSCQNPEKENYLRKQLVALVISGDAKQHIQDNLKVGIAAEAKSPDAAQGKLPVDASGKLQIEVASAVDKAIETAIAKNYYLLGVSFQD